MCSGVLDAAEKEILLGLKYPFRVLYQTRDLRPDLSYHRSKDDLLKDT